MIHCRPQSVYLHIIVLFLHFLSASKWQTAFFHVTSVLWNFIFNDSKTLTEEQHTHTHFVCFWRQLPVPSALSLWMTVKGNNVVKCDSYLPSSPPHPLKHPPFLVMPACVLLAQSCQTDIFYVCILYIKYWATNYVSRNVSCCCHPSMSYLITNININH